MNPIVETQESPASGVVKLASPIAGTVAGNEKLLENLFRALQGNFWTLTFMSQNKIGHKNFFCPGDLRKAIARGQDHCKLVRTRFLFVTPLISDLNADEIRIEGIG